MGKFKKCKIIDILEYQRLKVTPGISGIQLLLLKSDMSSIYVLSS